MKNKKYIYIMRRIKNLDGEISYCDNDNNIIGSGIFTDMLANIGSKLTSSTSKKLANIAAEKIISKGAEKLGEEIGNQGAKKIDRMFQKKR